MKKSKAEKKLLIVIYFIIGLLMVVFFSIPFISSWKKKVAIEESREGFETRHYLNDFNYAFNLISEAYPYLEINKEINSIDFIEKEDDYKSIIRMAVTPENFRSSLAVCLYDLNDSKTYVVSSDYALNSYLGYKNLPEDDYRHNYAELYEKDHVRKRYGITDAKVQEAIRRNEGKDGSKGDNNTLNIDYKNAQCQSLHDGKLGYIYVPSMISPDINDKEFNNDYQMIRKFLQENKDSQALIIDIRGNKGGDSRYYSDFLLPLIIDKDHSMKAYTFMKKSPVLEKVIENEGYKSLTVERLNELGFEEKTLKYIKDFDYISNHDLTISPSEESINFKGNIYLLIDRGVLSSAEILAAFVDETEMGVLVGDMTGRYWEIGSYPVEVALSNTGYVMGFSKELGVTGGGKVSLIDRIHPDIKIEPHASKRLVNDEGIDIENDACILEVLKKEGLNQAN